MMTLKLSRSVFSYLAVGRNLQVRISMALINAGNCQSRLHRCCTCDSCAERKRICLD